MAGRLTAPSHAKKAAENAMTQETLPLNTHDNEEEQIEEEYLV